MNKLLFSMITCFSLSVLVASQNIKAEMNGVIPEKIQMNAAEKAKQRQVMALIKQRNRVHQQQDEPVEPEWLTLAVPYYKQINGWYCGPSTTLQTEVFFNPESLSTQASLAKELGTTKSGTIYSNIKTVLNKRDYITEKYGFLNVTKDSTETLASWIGYSIQKGRPVVLNIAIFPKNTKSKAEFGYLSNGHFLNATGVYGEALDEGISNITQVQFTDPYNEWGAKPPTPEGPGIVRTTIGVTKAIVENQPSSTKNILW